MDDDEQQPAVQSAEDAELGRGVAERIRVAIQGQNPEEVARRAGINRKTLSRYLRGETPKLRALIAIAEMCGVSFEWLATGTIERAELDIARVAGTNPFGPELAIGTVVARGPTLPQPSGQGRQYVAIPRYNIQASAGGGALAEHAQVVEYLAFDVDFLRTRLRRDPKHLVLIEARGDSMEPTIRDGDILTVDIGPDQAVQHSQVHVIRVADDLIVKRLERRLDGGLIVHSDNTRYAPETLARDQLDTLHILGRVLLVTTPPR